jgi:hypothetical protein
MWRPAFFELLSYRLGKARTSGVGIEASAGVVGGDI